jgi:hypothetical protein
VKTRDLLRWVNESERLGMAPRVHEDAESEVLFGSDRSGKVHRVGMGLRRFCEWARRKTNEGGERR